MSIEYGTFKCRICGREGFAPLPAENDPSLESGIVELTCSQAHTDQYDITAIRRVITKPQVGALAMEAYAGAV
jgi:hypothetical protein